MKDFLHEILIDPFSDGDWVGYVIGVLLWLCLIALVGLVLWGLIYLIDSSFLPIEEKEGIVTNKYIVPAHTTTTFIQSGKVFIPITTFHETSYHIEIKINELSDDVSLLESGYDFVHVGRKCWCKYTSGRIMNTIYIKEIQW